MNLTQLFKDPHGRVPLLLATVRRKPLFPFYAALWSLRQRAGKRAYRGVMFATHYRCNFNCVHCYEKRFNKSNRQLMSLEKKLDVIDQVIAMGVPAFDFVGGESHLDPDFETLLRRTKPWRTYVSLTTNGFGFTAGKIRRLRALGLDKLNISIDSWNAEEHDSFRRMPGAHASALQTMELCGELGMDVTLSTVVDNGRTQDEGFRQLVRHSIDNGIRTAFKLAVPLGRWEEAEDQLVTQEDLDYIEAIHAEHPFMTRDIYGNPDCHCPAFRDFFTISAYGDIMPCNAIHASFGNIHDDSLASILEQVEDKGMFPLKYRGCPPAEDTSFIKSMLDGIAQCDTYPPRVEDVDLKLPGKHGGPQ